MGLLDTGATDCILPREVAEFIRPVPFAGQWFMTDYAGVPREVTVACESLLPVEIDTTEKNP